MHREMRAAFRVLCILSTMLLASGLYDVVWWFVEPRSWLRDSHSCEVKVEPRLGGMCSGTANLDTQAERNAEAQDEYIILSF